MNDRILFRVGVVIATLPIAVAAIRNGLNGWYPTADAAITAIRTRDVFSAHIPLVGLPTSTSMVSNVQYSYLGAPINYLLAIPVKLLGVSWGIVIGMAIFNTFWLVLALWFIRRRLGYRAGLVACLFGVSLLWAVGSQILIDPTPVVLGITASFALFASAWSVAEGDSVAIAVFAILGNFLILDHLKFAIPVILLGAVALVCGWKKLRCARPFRWTLVGAIGAAIMWIPPLIDQFFTSNGNISQMVRAMSAPQTTPVPPSIHRSLLDTIGVVSTPIATLPLWFRDSFHHPHYSQFGPAAPFVTETIGLAIVLVLCGVAAWSARIRRDSTILTGLAIALIAWIAWLLNGLSMPNDSGWPLRYYHDVWPVAAFLWMVLIMSFVRSRSLSQLRSTRWAKVGAPGVSLCGIALFAILSFPLANFDASTPDFSVELAHKIQQSARAIAPREGSILVNSDGANEWLLPDVLLALQDERIDFRLDSDWDIRTYGARRAYHGDAHWQLFLAPKKMTSDRQSDLHGVKIREGTYLYIKSL